MIRNHIAEMAFNKNTYKQVFTKSDQIYDSNQTHTVRGATAAAISAQPSQETPEVAATSSGRGRGRGRGQSRSRGGGSSSTRTVPAANANQASTTQNQGHKGPRHATAKGSNDKLCKIHYRWGENGSYCAAPWKCPMKDVYKSPQ